MTGATPSGPPSSDAGQSVVTIGQFFATLRRRLPTVLVMMILGVALAGGLLFNTAKTYQATAVVDISPTSGAAATSVSTITESRIVTSTSVAAAAQQILAYPGTPTELAEHVTVTSPLASQVLNITFAAASAQGAADGANAFANAYLAYRTEIAQKDITLRIGRIQSQVADLQESLAALTGANNSQRGLLQNQIQQLQNQLNTYQTSVISPGQVAGAAAVPESPSSPRPLLYLAGGLLLGLLLGIISAVVRERRDDRVPDSVSLGHSLGIPVIAEFTAAEGGAKAPTALAATADTRGAEADAYRTVATAVTAHASANSRIVLVCGTGQQGFSLAPLNLAATFAQQGLQTVIAGPDRAAGLAAELLQVQSMPQAQHAQLADQLAPSSQLPRLAVLSLGDEVSLGATLHTNDDGLSEILAKVDIIVLDGMNIELASTSLRLGKIAHEAVVVAYKNRSTHSEIERLARQLTQVNVDLLGGILLSRPSWRDKLPGRAHRAPRRPSGSVGRREVAKAQPGSPARMQAHPVQAPGKASAAPTSSAAGDSVPVFQDTPIAGSSGSASSRPATARKS